MRCLLVKHCGNKIQTQVVVVNSRTRLLSLPAMVGEAFRSSESIVIRAAQVMGTQACCLCGHRTSMPGVSNSPE